ncbi:DUF86 domain-containing protein [Cupriavidus sp. AU9028]|uniref:HepT-like ribonuclease domain-containing protein n=1 Tax=Cupriavidus sp. AU9028 TaxID=2871157 RepID=UPI001C98A3F7|nr:DUF86 domain-containing protein [Cupriavidus sp. AU9028]MBY4895583.1 DUF86 domain-containing protein [Cupriavidus sp. AU9028]
MNKSLRVPDYLGHILDALERIDGYTAGMDEASFLRTPMVQDAVVRNIEIIGEAANNVQRMAPAFVAEHADIPWQVMYAMRNRLCHAYHKVDLRIVWLTIKRDLPALFTQVKQLYEAIAGSSPTTPQDEE